MKLYSFESCPFCVRVRVVLGLKGIPVETVFLSAGAIPDDLEGRIKQLVVPLLDRGDADGELMGESTNIIRWLDQQYGAPLLAEYQISDSVQQWLKIATPILDSLFYPRMLAAELPELASPQARHFFLATRPAKLGCSLVQAVVDTDHHLEILSPRLAVLETLLAPEALLTGARPVSFEDIAVFAALRNLQMVDRAVLSPEMLRYMAFIRELAAISTMDVIPDALSLQALSA